MRTFVVAVAAVIAVAATVVAGAGAGPPKPPKPPHDVVGQVYVNDNTTPANTVAGFDRHADGSLTPIPGSPFAVGGAGTGHGDASQGSLQLSDDGRYLLAVDAGSNQISVLRIRHDGSLDPADDTPVSSAGVDPVSIAVHDHLVYVANQGPGVNPGDANYTGFTLDPGGHLTAIPGSTIPLPNNSKPGDVLFSPDGRKLVGTRIASSQIDSFTVDDHGLLTNAPGSPFNAQSFSPPQGWGQLGAEFSPTDSGQLFVTDAHTAAGGGATPGLVSSFSDDANGVLAPIAPSPVADGGGTAACWIEISADGAYAFVVDTGSASISTYSIADGGTLSFLTSTPSGELGPGAEDARLAPDGGTLWVVQAGADAVNGFTVDGGSLTPLTQVAGPAGAAPTGIVVT
jgi:6-phosphogluconolactonase (cycloisomerase 2 family)